MVANHNQYFYTCASKRRRVKNKVSDYDWLRRCASTHEKNQGPPHQNTFTVKELLQNLIDGRVPIVFLITAVNVFSFSNFAPKGKSSFSCDTCGAALPYDEVRIKALLTPEEKEHFEKTLAFNATKTNPDTKICPGCNTSVARRQLSNLSVNCRVCTKRTGQPFEFCWQCLKKWKGNRSRTDRCDNDGCCNEALKTLKTCPVVIFQDIKDISSCPSIRACPTCGALLKHSGKMCKNITCTRCKIQFCFVCLQLTSKCLPTSNYFTPCAIPVAPRQTSIPQWNKD
uniref:RING-type domain-containing protein n=1 Tax=Gouania willdenowi TaxID=441366 RepID=A0A8C5F0I0_GOUWI